MKPIMRNRYLVALESAMSASKDGRRPRGFIAKAVAQIAEKGGIFKRVLFQGELVYLPVNRIALDEFILMPTEERVQIMFSQPPPTKPTPKPCESKRILQGSRFKGAPRGVRESDLFDGEGNPRFTVQQMHDGEGPGHHTKQGDIYVRRVTGHIRLKRGAKVAPIDVVAMAMKQYNLGWEDATLLVEELKRRVKA